jgi:dipeptidyl aminopeptidase/acylaminoacyl peptidase
MEAAAADSGEHVSIELTAELIADGAAPSDPVISPDGRWVAYVVAPIGAQKGMRRADLWVAATDASTAPRRFTHGGAGVARPRWSADSATVYFLRDDQLHKIRLDGGEATALTSWGAAISGYLPLHGADGQIAVLAPDEGEPCDPVVWSECAASHRLRLLNPASAQLRVVAGLGDRHVREVTQRPDGGPLAVLTWSRPEDEPGSFDVRFHLVDPVTDEVTDLGPAELGAEGAAWWRAADGWHLCYLALTPPLRFAKTAVDMIPGEDGAHRDLAEGMTVCPLELAQVTGAPLLALFADGLDTAVYRLDPDSRQFQQVSMHRGSMQSLTASASGELIAGRASTAYEPKDIHAGPVAGPLNRLSDTRPETRSITWGTQERLAWKAADGLPLDGLLILPPGKTRADGPFPLITHVHGGPYGRHADDFKGSFWPDSQALAAGGYAVFMPNPRGGEGHGREFATLVANALGQEEWTDTLSGIDLLIADGVADPERLGIGGASHGGFITAWAVGQTDRFKAALMNAGICDWGMLVGTGELGRWDLDLAGTGGWEGPGPHPHDQISPLSYASRVRTPVLIVHGEKDTNVPVGQAVNFHRAISQFSTGHELVIYPREGHGLKERDHQLDLLRRSRAWFDRWLLQ